MKIIFINLLLVLSVCDLSQSQIVTPDRFLEKNQTHGSAKGDIKVEVSEQRLKEAKAFRDEISRAVEQNRYHIQLDDFNKFENTSLPGQRTNSTGPIVKVSIDPTLKFDKTSSNENSRNNKDEDEKSVGDAKFDLADKVRNIVIEAPDETTKPFSTTPESSEPPIDIIANTVESLLTPDDREDGKKFLLQDFLPKQFANREILTVKSIEEDPKFMGGDGVREWKVLKTEDQNHWIGLEEQKLLIISDENYTNVLHIGFGYHIESIETFSFWNTTSDRSVGVILMSIEGSICWVETRSWQRVWQWNIGKKVKIMKYYQIDGREYLAILTSTIEDKKYAIHVYEFIEENREFWIIQVIPLKNATDEMIFLDTGREAILAVTQGNDVLVYDYNPDVEFRYDLAEQFTSEDLKSIAGFKMGGYSYLAISGRQAKILRYYRGDFVPQTLFGENYKWVHRYFAIPARTYRDDMILLVQHSMEFAGHSLVVLEALVWNGQSFEASGDIPCLMGGETFNFGGSCMIDLEREAGIAGAAIIDSGRNISIIVPREDAPSGKFTIHTVLKERKTEQQELQDIFQFLNATLAEQNKVIEDAQTVIEYAGQPDIIDLEYFSATEVMFDGEIDKIFLNGLKWTQDNESFDFEGLLKELELLSEEVQGLATKIEVEDLQDIEDCLNPKQTVKRSADRYDYIDLELDSVSIENLQVGIINGRTIPNLITNNSLSFNGTIEILSKITVFDKLNILDGNKRARAEEETLDTISVDDLTIEGDLHFETINGVQWKEFLGKVNLLKFPVQLENLIVEGDVVFDQQLDISTLNGISYPDGFLWSSGRSQNVVTARKNFTGLLEANAMDTGGLINGVDPFTMVTLSGDQVIPSRTVFKSLEVTEQLELNGTVSGNGLSDFLSNPTLLQTFVIHSACQFNELHVTNGITVVNRFNGQNFDEILEDVVYEKSDAIEIEGTKSFAESFTCTEGVQISSRKINDIEVEDFVTLDTDQELDITSLQGEISFRNLDLKGLYNSIDVADLLENVVRVDSNELINVTLIVENPNLLHLAQLTVVDSINQMPCNSLLTIDGELQFEELKLENVTAERVATDADIDGPDKMLNGMKIAALQVQSDWHKDAANDSNQLFMDELVLESDLSLEYLNGYEVHKAMQILEKVHDIPFMVKQGLVTVREMIVNGHVKLNTINGRAFAEEILQKVIWLNRENYIPNPVVFGDVIEFNDNLQISGLLNEQNLSAILNDIVWRECPELMANKTDRPWVASHKSFLNPLEIENNANVEYLNKGVTRHLARTDADCEFKGNVNVYGDLEVSSLSVGTHFNDIESEVFTNMCRFDSDLDAYVIGGPVHFSGLTEIENLHLMGSINGLDMGGDLVRNMVFLNESAVLLSDVIFENRVEVKAEAQVGHVDGHNLTHAFDQIVYDDDGEAIEIHGPIGFMAPITVDTMHIEDVLCTTHLAGCDLLEWQANSLRIDEDISIPKLFFTKGSLDSNALNVAYLNERDLTQLVTLHTEQTFANEVHMSEMFLTGSLETIYPVNDRYDLKTEMENTVMKNMPQQHITSPITAQSFTVLKDLLIDCLVNEERNLSDVVHFQMPTIEMHTPVFFRNLTVPRVFTKDFISGFNFNQWYDQSLWADGREQQTITGKWSIAQLNVKQKLVGRQNFNDIPLDMIRGQLNGPSDDQQKQFKRMADNYNVLCRKVQHVVKRSQNRVYFIKYFEQTAMHQKDSPINSISIFEHAGIHYMLTNVECYTNIYRWDSRHSQFLLLNQFESGSVAEFVPVPDASGVLSLMINSKLSQLSQCKNHGVTNWIFNDGNVSNTGQLFGQHDFDSIHYDPANGGVIYGIPVEQNSIVELNVNNHEESYIWELPSESQGLYRFLPAQTEFGTAVTDGKQIMQISRNKESDKSRRRKREVKANSNANSSVSAVKEDLRALLGRSIRNLTYTIEALDRIANSKTESFNETDALELKQVLHEVHQLAIAQGVGFSIPPGLNTSIDPHIHQIGQIVLNVTKSLWADLKQAVDLKDVFKQHKSIADHQLIRESVGYLESLKVFNGKLITGMMDKMSNIAEIVTQNSTLLAADASNNTTIPEKLKQTLHSLRSFLLTRLEFLIPVNTSDAKSTANKPESKPVQAAQRGIQFIPIKAKNLVEPLPNKTANPLFNRKALEAYFQEPVVGQAPPSSARNLLIADNPHVPNKIAGEVLAIEVSYKENRHTLYAVTNNALAQKYGTGGSIQDEEKGSIKVFFDIMQGHVFHQIEAHNPTSLTVMYVRDETVLGFVDDGNLIKLYIYRGIEGFVKFVNIQSEYEIKRLLSVALPNTADGRNGSGCPDFYFVAVGEYYFSFYKAILAGTCSVDDDLQCGNWT